jgi:hypothetical protein
LHVNPRLISLTTCLDTCRSRYPKKVLPGGETTGCFCRHYAEQVFRPRRSTFLDGPLSDRKLHVSRTYPIYANDCCGVAWPADATLRHEVNVSHQRIHELKHVLKKAGELVIVERPGFTNLYFVAWQGKPLGGAFPETGRHDPYCPLRYAPAPEQREGAEMPDTPLREEVSETSEARGSEISEGGSQSSLRRKQGNTRAENEAPVARAPDTAKAEAASPYWCAACGFSIPACPHRTIYARPSARPGGPLTLVGHALMAVHPAPG